MEPQADPAIHENMKGVALVGLNVSMASRFAPAPDRREVKLRIDTQTIQPADFKGRGRGNFIRGRMSESLRWERKREGYGPVLALAGGAPTTAKTGTVLVHRRNCWFCWGFQI